MPAILFAILCSFVLKTSSYPIAGQSMKPTLNAGERVLVQRTKQVTRYDVIAFKAPLASRGTYVKRIIGGPGDRIWVNETKLYLSEEPIASDNEALPENASRFDLSEKAAAQLRLFQKIPAGHYFVLGTIVRIQVIVVRSALSRYKRLKESWCLKWRRLRK